MKFGLISTEMSFDEAKRIDALMTRDTAVPVVMRTYTEGEEAYYFCPVCDRLIVVKGAKFCVKCGQRLDMENIAL